MKNGKDSLKIIMEHSTISIFVKKLTELGKGVEEEV